MVSNPTVTPVTTPNRTVAFVLLAVQAPPPTDAVIVIFDPIPTDDGPLKVPATGFGLIVTKAVDTAVPHELV